MNPLQEDCLPPRRRWTRQEFERAGEMGLFRPDERLELIDGDIVRKGTPQGSEHAVAVQAVAAALGKAYGGTHHVRTQLPLVLGDSSEPEPDAAVVEGDFRDYRSEHPRTAVLVVEVSDSSLKYDRTVKSGLYAQASIPEYWIVNLADRTVEVHRNPGPMSEHPLGFAYRTSACYPESETVTPIGGQAIEVASLLP